MIIEVRSVAIGEEAIAAAIEKSSLSTAWSEKQILEAMENKNSHYLVALSEGEICGIASVYCLCGEGQLINLAVGENFRRRGVGDVLMKAVIALAKENNCENITLEVAENNLSAISLYTKWGFSPVGRRKGFYKGVDAIVYAFAFA